MNLTVESSAFDRAVAPVLRQVMPKFPGKEEVSFAADSSLACRIEELATKSTEGELTDQERDEYHGYVRANKFIATLQRQLRRLLNSPAGCELTNRRKFRCVNEHGFAAGIVSLNRKIRRLASYGPSIHGWAWRAKTVATIISNAHIGSRLVSCSDRRAVIQKIAND